MRKGQGGQVFILVLILLAIGTAMVVPSLRLTGTSLKSSQIVTQQTNSMYAADAAQEYVLWKLYYDAAFRNLFQKIGDNVTFPFELNGVLVDTTVIMRAVPGAGGVTLARDDVIRPTKSVIPNAHPYGYREYTYFIRLQQVSDNNTRGLDAIYDILPKGFEVSNYVMGSSKMSVDGGTTWLPVPDPNRYVDQNQLVLRWPAGYNYQTGTDAFSSNPLDQAHYFYGMRDFQVGQVKQLQFRVYGTLRRKDVHVNWLVLKPWNTVSGPQAPILVDLNEYPGTYADGLLAITKASNPEVIPGGVASDIKYTISITNQDGFAHQIQEITDYLPPEFYYTENSTRGITTLDPILSLENINGVDRWVLLWTKAEFPGGNAVRIASEQTLTLTFWARTTPEVTGTYYNEAVVIPDVPVPQVFQNIGVLPEDFWTCYSWNVGPVMVPAYDSRAEAEGVTIDANIELVVAGISIKSWQVK